MTPKIGSYAVALAILFASSAFGQTETGKDPIATAGAIGRSGHD